MITGEGIPWVILFGAFAVTWLTPKKKASKFDILGGLLRELLGL
jgi:hypothetical protein